THNYLEIIQDDISVNCSDIAGTGDWRRADSSAPSAAGHLALTRISGAPHCDPAGRGGHAAHLLSAGDLATASRPATRHLAESRSSGAPHLGSAGGGRDAADLLSA